MFNKYDSALPGIFTENFDAVVDSCKRNLKKEIVNLDIDLLKEHEIVEIINAKLSGQESVSKWKESIRISMENDTIKLKELIKQN